MLQELALTHPDRLVGLHLSGTNPFLAEVPDDLSPAEQEFVDAARGWNQAEMAYAMEHSTKPQTLAHALTDSRPGSPPGSSRSSGPGATATVTSTRSTAARTC